jgi:pyruvate,orthophosphate dikinase
VPLAGGDVMRALLIKGETGLEALADSLLVARDVALAILQRLAAGQRAEETEDGWRLTAEGKADARAQLAGDRDRWGVVRAEGALEGFQALDRDVKAAVTAWQLREVGGAQTLNDHTDATYDAQVLDRLSAVHRRATAWLSSLDGAPEDLARFGERLQRALDAARANDGRFVASPRVDSYHGVWFELHEELILLAGRSRADEAAAGRA